MLKYTKGVVKEDNLFLIYIHSDRSSLRIATVVRAKHLYYYAFKKSMLGDASPLLSFERIKLWKIRRFI